MKTLNEQNSQEDIDNNDPEWLKAIKDTKQRFFDLIEDDNRALIELGYATQIINDSDKLRQCDKVSIMNAVINVARTGITLNPILGLAHLINRGGKCCLHFDYKGLVKILKDNNCIKDIQAIIVYEDETYEEGIGQITPPKHIKAYAKTEAEQMKRNYFGVYCQVVLLDNTVIYTQLMPYWEVLKAEKMSPAAHTEHSPWQRNKWRETMIKKTKIRHDFKLLISGSPNDRIKAAMEVEDTSYTEVKNELPKHKPKAVDLFLDSAIIQPDIIMPEAKTPVRKSKKEHNGKIDIKMVDFTPSQDKAYPGSTSSNPDYVLKMNVDSPSQTTTILVDKENIIVQPEPPVESFFTEEEIQRHNDIENKLKEKLEQGKALRKKAGI